jgi:hypothetical protein
LTSTLAFWTAHFCLHTCVCLKKSWPPSINCQFFHDPPTFFPPPLGINNDRSLMYAQIQNICKLNNLKVFRSKIINEPKHNSQKLYHDENRLIVIAMMVRSTLYKTNTLSCILIVLVHWNNSPRVYMSLHSEILLKVALNTTGLTLMNHVCPVFVWF